MCVKCAPFKREIRLATLANFRASIQRGREELPVPKKGEKKEGWMLGDKGTAILYLTGSRTGRVVTPLGLRKIFFPSQE